MTAQSDAVELLEDAQDKLREVIGLVDDAYRVLPDGSKAERVRQVRAQLEMALDDEHEWLGSNSYTIANSIKELDTSYFYVEGVSPDEFYIMGREDNEPVSDAFDSREAAEEALEAGEVL